MRISDFIDKPKLFTEHTNTQCFCGQDVIEIDSGELWMFAHYGAPPASFRSNHNTNESLVYKSNDDGKTWCGPHQVDINYLIDGMICEGGRSVLRLNSGKIIMVSHRSSSAFKTQGSHGIPAIIDSTDGGKTWSPARLLTDEPEDYIYVMNQRLIQMQSGRILLAVSGRDKDTLSKEYREGVHPTVGFFYSSDDEGTTWQRSDTSVKQHTERGVQEPAIIEYASNKLIMLFRSGLGCHQVCYSENGGKSWSEPQDTTLTSACSSFGLTKLPDGRLIVVYNHAVPFYSGSYFPRNPLVYATSSDARNWSEPVLIDHQECRQLIYPSIKPLSVGVLIVYSAHYAASDGSFYCPDDSWKVGGGKTCVISV